MLPHTGPNLNFLAVVKALVFGETKTRDALDSDIANAELATVMDAKGIATSPLMQQQIDYTQFKVRGKYTQTPGPYKLFSGHAVQQLCIVSGAFVQGHRHY